MTDNLNKNRSIYIDIVKAIAIICVIVGHCIQFGSGQEYLINKEFYNNTLFKIIYSFHMPLFMLLSGYLSAKSISNKSLKDLVQSKIKTLVIPILLWSLIPWISSLAHSYICNEQPSFIEIVCKYLSVSSLNLWFLWAVFWCSIATGIVHKIFQDNILIYTMLYIILLFIPDVYNIHLYSFMYPYFVVGYLFNKKDTIKTFKQYINDNALIIILLCLYICLILFYNNDMYIYTTGNYILKGHILHQLFIDIYRLVTGFIGSIAVMIVIYKIFKIIGHNKLTLIAYIGEKSMGLYIISGLIISYILCRLSVYIEDINYILIILETTIVTILSLLITQIISYSKVVNRLFLGGR